MSTQKINVAAKIISELKIMKGFRKDVELAVWLGVTAQALSNWKSRGYIADIDILKQKGFSENWVRTGEGDKFLQTVSGYGNIQGKTFEAENLHIDIHNGHVTEHPLEYNPRDPVEEAFLNDWRSLNEVVKMRIWMIVKEEKEKIKHKLSG